MTRYDSIYIDHISCSEYHIHAETDISSIKWNLIKNFDFIERFHIILELF